LLTPEEVMVMRQLLQRGWSRRRIAAELGISRNTLNRYLTLGQWKPYICANRSGQLDGHRDWLQQQFEQHHSNAEVVRQELWKQKGIEVSLRTVERGVQAWREALRQSRQATVRYETPPGKQLQADFGELWVPIGGVISSPHFVDNGLFAQQSAQQKQQRSEIRARWGIPEDAYCFLFANFKTKSDPVQLAYESNPAGVPAQWGWKPVVSHQK